MIYYILGGVFAGILVLTVLYLNWGFGSKRPPSMTHRNQGKDLDPSSPAARLAVALLFLFPGGICTLFGFWILVLSVAELFSSPGSILGLFFAFFIVLMGISMCVVGYRIAAGVPGYGARAHPDEERGSALFGLILMFVPYLFFFLLGLAGLLAGYLPGLVFLLLGGGGVALYAYLEMDSRRRKNGKDHGRCPYCGKRAQEGRERCQYCGWRIK